MTRIVAGLARGRTLRVPAKGTRPTSDRVRESCFSTLDSRFLAQGLAWADVRVLDLFAGSGALGLEAVSRGARSAVLVERSRDAARILRGNIETVGLPGCLVVERDAMRLAAPGVDAAQLLPADLVFADPPYDLAAADLRAMLSSLAANGWIASGATVVAERATRDDDEPLPGGWQDGARRVFGDTALWYGRVSEG